MESNVCVVVNMGGDHGVFNLDLDGVDAGSDEVVDLHNLRPPEDGFVNRDPNFIIRDAGCVCFCGMKGDLFMIEGVTRGETEESCKVRIYKFDSTFLLSRPSNFILHTQMLPVVSRLHSVKLRPAAVRCEAGILIFSTEISYENYGGPLNDFEILDCDGLCTVRLPSLRIFLREDPNRVHTRQFWFIRNSKRSRRITPTGGNADFEDFDNSSFQITMFSMIDSATLVVGTSFGGMFYLGLHPPSWHVFEGTPFPHFHENIVTNDYNISLSPFGASKFSTADHDCGDRQIRFPLSSRVSPHYLWRNFAIGLPENSMHPYYVPYIMQVGFDHAELAHWTLDAVLLDAREFDDELVEFGRRIKSFKFVSGPNGLPFCPMCVYPH